MFFAPVREERHQDHERRSNGHDSPENWPDTNNDGAAHLGRPLFWAQQPSIHPPREYPPQSCLLWVAAAHASSKEAVVVVFKDVQKYADLAPNQVS